MGNVTGIVRMKEYTESATQQGLNSRPSSTRTVAIPEERRCDLAHGDRAVSPVQMVLSEQQLRQNVEEDLKPSTNAVLRDSTPLQNCAFEEYTALNDSPHTSHPMALPQSTSELERNQSRAQTSHTHNDGSGCSLLARSLLISLGALAGASTIVGIISWHLFKESRSVELSPNDSSLLILLLNGSAFPHRNDLRMYLDDDNGTWAPIGLT
ncbi:uncharacterized protein LOC135383080 [Ornithodoros turicata]|uniref:uncharacterized protein LOC135383080 n=1 Tax=Ornithodoros turicata TaxID=34597 RepID=UPI003139EB0A